MQYSGPSRVRTLAFVGLILIVVVAVVGTLIVPIMIPLWMVLVVCSIAGFLLIAYKMWSCPRCPGAS